MVSNSVFFCYIHKVQQLSPQSNFETLSYSLVVTVYSPQVPTLIANQPVIFLVCMDCLCQTFHPDRLIQYVIF